MASAAGQRQPTVLCDAIKQRERRRAADEQQREKTRPTEMQTLVMGEELEIRAMNGCFCTPERTSEPTCDA